MVQRAIMVFVFLILFILGHTTGFAANYAETFGASPQGVALGNAMVARVNDWSSPYYNIAGLGKTVHLLNSNTEEEARKNQIAVSYLYNSPSFDIDINAEGGERYYYLDDVKTVAPTQGDEFLETGTVVVGLALDMNTIYEMPVSLSSSRVGVVLGLNSDLTVMKINDIDPRTHNFVRYGRESQTLLLIGGFGLGFMNDAFGLGLGINSTFRGDGNILLEDVQLIEEAQQPGTISRIDMEISSAMIAGGYFSPGKIFPPLKGVELGISLKTEKYFSFEPLNLNAQLDSSDIIVLMELALFDFYQPASITAGVAYSIADIVLSCDVELQQWSEFQMSDLKTAQYIGPVPEMEDILIIKAGVDYALGKSTHLLAGYCRQPSFIPDSAVTGPYNYLDNDKQIGSAGFSYTFPSVKGFTGTMDFVGAYQIQILEEREVIKDAPTQNIIDIYGSAENYTLINPGYTFGGICHSVFVGLNINL